MCGINGFNYADKELLQRMEKFTQKRGPDANGYYIEDGISLGHNRLSIIDISENANQPLEFKDYVITFNGEIYNYKYLREIILSKGIKLKTFSDTEVILALFSIYGIKSFKMLSGIFAIAIWNKKKGKLYLIRDHLGVKPLYYIYNKDINRLFFSSSIKSLMETTKVKKISKTALFFYQNLGRNDAEETFISNIRKLSPAELIICGQNFFIKKKNFLKFNYCKKYLNDQEIKKKVEDIISKQFISDVPIALSLSGGIDSNVVYHCLRKNYHKNLSVYSFFFKDYDKFNEDYKIAEENVKKYGNNFVPVVIGYKDFIEHTEKTVDILEEPLRNEASVLNYVMSKNVREKVLITGDGGDEIFTGYDQYRSIYYLTVLNKFNFLKKILKRNFFHNKQLQRLFSKDSKDLFLSFSERNIFKTPEKYYKNFNNISTNELVLNHSKNQIFNYKLNEVSKIELDTRVQNDYLLRNDKIFMNEGIELRVPFLDQEMIENFLNLSEHRKFGYLGKSKYLLKKLFINNINKTTKKKWGLQSPLAKWMKNELQPYIKEILSDTYYSGGKNYLNFEEIEKLIRLHKENYFNHTLIWSLLNFQIYIRKFNL